MSTLRRLIAGAALVAPMLAATVEACGGSVTSTQTCGAGDLECSGVCTAARKDPENCGACGHVCGQGTVCYQGDCATSCGGGTVPCDQACVNPTVDPENCGACGHVCGQGTVCYQGECATSCGGGTVPCNQACVDPKVDPENCGACGASCTAGFACVDGTCNSKCTPTQTLCTVGDAGPYCAATASDNANCGSCGKECADGEACSQGACVSACLPTQTLCKVNGLTYCTDVTTDVANCGSCGSPCPSHAYCSAGACACQTGYAKCLNSCVDLSTDLANCGACGASCTGTCALGRCSTVVVPSGGAVSIAVDGAYVYWGTPSEVRRSPKSGGASSLISSASFASQILVDGVNVYWINYATTPKTIASVPVGGGALTTVASDSSIESIATDGTSVFWANFSGRSVNAAPVGGGPATVLATSSAGPLFVIREGPWVYWSDNFPKVYRVTTGGFFASTLAAPSSSTIMPIAADTTQVYMGDGAGHRILSVANDGSKLPVVIASGIWSPSAILSDGSYVYWLESQCCPMSRVMKVPVGGGAPIVLATGVNINANPSFAMDGDSLYWNALGPGAVMRLTPK